MATFQGRAAPDLLSGPFDGAADHAGGLQYRDNILEERSQGGDLALQPKALADVGDFGRLSTQ